MHHRDAIIVSTKKHLERERRRISGAARDGSKSKRELAGKMRGEKEEREREREKEGEKGGAETREICAGFVDPAVGPQKDEICFHFHLWQPAKISSGPISSLQTVIRLRQYFFLLLPTSSPSPRFSLFSSPFFISYERIFRIQAKSSATLTSIYTYREIMIKIHHNSSAVCDFSVRLKKFFCPCNNNISLFVIKKSLNYMILKKIISLFVLYLHESS